MSKNITLGGNRLGAGNNMQVEVNDFVRSNHDLGRVFRTTMSAGTLVPFIVEVATPGDTFDITLDGRVLTPPTIGALFGSFKLQMDVFSVPMRLYQKQLHNNPAGVGLKMNEVKLPLIEINAPNIVPAYGNIAHQQVHPSSLLAYLGIKSFGYNRGELTHFRRYFDAGPLYAYYDIFKNYYANKQLDYAYVIHSDIDNSKGFIKAASWTTQSNVGNELVNGNVFTMNPSITYLSNNIADQYVRFHGTNVVPECLELTCKYQKTTNGTAGPVLDLVVNVLEYFEITYQSDELLELRFKKSSEAVGYDVIWKIYEISYRCTENLNKLGITLHEFELKEIDRMREAILGWNTATAFSTGNVLGQGGNIEPFDLSFREYYNSEEPTIPHLLSCSQPQEGLVVKGYQADIFNTYLREEDITGEGGIAELTRIDTSAGYFEVDAFNIAVKVYKMLNRIMAFGGTYNDYILGAYGVQGRLNNEIPIFEGGAYQEVVFQEVVSNASTKDQPLGTIAARGMNRSKQHGGHIIVRCHEPSYIIGLVSLTPRIDYSDGNKWFTSLKTIDDLHKPQLDGIGFQDLITEWMAGCTTHVQIDGTCDYKAVGKQPAWINYMTNYNEVYGNFALENNQLWMTLARRFNIVLDEDTNDIDIADVTTYIDPTKYNHIFAQTSLDSMNFWVQIAYEMNKRSVMSAKIMPNI